MLSWWVVGISCFLLAVGASPMDDFNNWFHELSPINSRVRFNQSQWGVGVFVGEDAPVKSLDLVMQVPLTKAFATEIIRKRPYGHVLPLNLDEENAIAFALLIERALGTKSQFGAWMQVVPQLGPNMSPPHTWPDAIISVIEPADIRKKVMQRKRDIEDQYKKHATKKAVKAMATWVARELNADPSQSKSVNPEAMEEEFSLRRFTWAKALIDTRAWNMNGRKYLVPGPDMFNHRPDSGEDADFEFTKVRWDHPRSQKFLTHHKIEGQSSGAVLKVFSDRNAGPKEQLFESYGDNSDEIYFVYHGFLPAVPENHMFPENTNQHSTKAKLTDDVWLKDKIARNFYDCAEIQMDVPNDADFNKYIKGERTKEENSKMTEAEKKERNERMQKVAKAHKGLQRNRFKVFSTFFPNVRQPQLCHHYGELHPMLLAFSYVMSTPQAVLDGECLKAIRDPARNRYAFVHESVNGFIESLLRCIDEDWKLRVKEGRTALQETEWRESSLAAVHNQTMFYLKRSVMTQFRKQFQTSDLSQDVQVLRRLVAWQSKPTDGEWQKLQEHVPGLDEENVGMHVTRLRFSLQRKLIFRELTRRINLHNKNGLKKGDRPRGWRKERPVRDEL